MWLYTLVGIVTAGEGSEHGFDEHKIPGKRLKAMRQRMIYEHSETMPSCHRDSNHMFTPYYYAPRERSMNSSESQG